MNAKIRQERMKIILIKQKKKKSKEKFDKRKNTENLNNFCFVNHAQKSMTALSQMWQKTRKSNDHKGHEK